MHHKSDLEKSGKRGIEQYEINNMNYLKVVCLLMDCIPNQPKKVMFSCLLIPVKTKTYKTFLLDVDCLNIFLLISAIFVTDDFGNSL